VSELVRAKLDSATLAGAFAFGKGANLSANRSQVATTQDTGLTVGFRGVVALSVQRRNSSVQLLGALGGVAASEGVQVQIQRQQRIPSDVQALLPTPA